MLDRIKLMREWTTRRDLDMTNRYIQVSIHGTFDSPTANVLVKQRTKKNKASCERERDKHKFKNTQSD